jgi:hypothetical protein
LLNKLSEAEQERRGYLRLAAKGQMTDEELDEALSEFEDTRKMAEMELEAIRNRQRVFEDLVRNRDALLESYARMTPEALDNLTTEERRKVYGMLRLRVEIFADGRMEASGVLRHDRGAIYETGEGTHVYDLCENELVPRPSS